MNHESWIMRIDKKKVVSINTGTMIRTSNFYVSRSLLRLPKYQKDYRTENIPRLCVNRKGLQKSFIHLN